MNFHNLKKTLALLLSVFIVFAAAPAAFAENFDSTLWSDRYIVLDYTTGKVLTEKNSDEISYPASLTKMMTAVLAYEYYSRFNADDWSSIKLTADSEASSTEGSRFGLATNEKIEIGQALNIMLLRSANDIAVMIAKNISGSVENFTTLMNEKAAALGCKNTHFVNPNGLHDDNHYSTAADLALIAEYFMSIDYLSSIVKQPYFEYKATSLRAGGTVTNTNLLLNSSQKVYVGNELVPIMYSEESGVEILGIKTGTTSEAGGCLALLVSKADTKLLIIILNSKSDYTYQTERYSDAHSLIDWAFEYYETCKVASSGDSFGSVRVKRGEFNKVNAELRNDVYATVDAIRTDKGISTTTELCESVTAPFDENTVVGTYTIYLDGEKLSSYSLYAQTGIEKGGILSVFGIEDAVADRIFMWSGIGLLIVALIAAVCLWVKKSSQPRIEKRNRLRQEYNEARKQALLMEIEQKKAEIERLEAEERRNSDK